LTQPMAEAFTHAHGFTGVLDKAPSSARTNLLLRAATAAALLIPCFWVDRIQAGDVSSHLYNAWLAIQIKSGAAPGLTIATTWTNVLCDWIMEALLRLAGPAWAEKIIVAAAVLLFYWGAFFLIHSATGRHPWFLAPCLAMLTYGLVFHFGFLNYYVSTGLCFCILGLLWQPTRLRFLLATPIAALALLAHALPLAWAIAVLAFLSVSRRMPPQWRWLLLPGGVAILAGAQTILVSYFPHRWSLKDLASLSGIAGLSGVEQVWLYGNQYLIVSVGLLLVFSAFLLQRLEEGAMISDPVAQLWMLHVAAFALLPSAIQFPQYQHVLAYIPQRVSLLSAVFLCITVGKLTPGRWIRRLLALVMTMFFTFLYLDDRALNLVGNEVAASVEKLPAGQRVVASISDSETRLNGLGHVVDRACVGHCFSYGNYEPATAQFRIRIDGQNPVVANSMETVKSLEDGGHLVTPNEAPLYSVCGCGGPGNPFCLRTLSAGERTCSFSLPLTAEIWSGWKALLP
jgi:hypothetical protein